MTGRDREALLSLGSNVAPWIHVPRALELLRVRHEVAAVSPLYRCPAVGGSAPQADFVNLAVRVRTDLPPRALREACRRIEEQCERRRTADRYAPRTLDLDVVFMPGVEQEFEDWRLPAAELTTQAFVLVPGADIWPDAAPPPGRRSLGERAAALAPGVRATLRELTPEALADLESGRLGRAEER